MKNKAIAVMIYLFWGFFSLLVCIYLTFPTDTLAQIIRAQLDARLGHRYEVRLDEVSLAGLTGITLQQLWLIPHRDTSRGDQSQPTTSEESGSSNEGAAAERDPANEGSGRAAPGGAGIAPLRLTPPTRIDQATVTLGVLSLLRRDPELSFEIELGDGQIYGSWEREEQADQGYRLEVSADRVPLENIGILSELAQGTVLGALTGHLTLHYNTERKLYGGELHFIDIENLTRQAGPLEIGPAPLYFATPIRLGHLHAEAVLEGTDLSIQAFDVTGGDLELQIPAGGRLSIREPMMDSYLRLTLQLAYSEEWLRANDLEGALRNIPLMREACEGNSCAIALTGPLTQIQTQPLRARRGY